MYCTTIKTLYKNNNQCKHWMTSIIIESIKKRDKLHSLIRHQPFNTDLINKYKQYRKKLTDIIEKQNLIFYGKIILKNYKSPKKLWTTINEITIQKQCSEL